MSILMFDIDGTLSRSQGAGTLAMSRTFEQLWGIHNALEGMNFAGRSDTWIVPTALANQGRDCSAEDLPRFIDVYVGHLADALVERDAQLCPGVSRCSRRWPKRMSHLDSVRATFVARPRRSSDRWVSGSTSSTAATAMIMPTGQSCSRPAWNG